MIPYFIFKDCISHEFKILVNRLPPVQVSQEEGEFIKVPGRSGYLYQFHDSFKETSKDIIITAMNLEKIEDIKQWLTGEGKLVLSSEPDVFYFARVTNQVDYSRLRIDRYKQATITFICQPHGYLRDSPERIVLDSRGTIYNPGTYKSKPIIEVFATGNVTLTINSKNIILTDINDHVTLNSEIEEAYRDLLSMNNRMQGEFPIFDVGANQISWVGNVTKLEITPNWRNR